MGWPMNDRDTVSQRDTTHGSPPSSGGRSDLRILLTRWKCKSLSTAIIVSLFGLLVTAFWPQQVVAAKPDLELSDISVTPDPPLYAGKTNIEIRVKFKNIGSG